MKFRVLVAVVAILVAACGGKEDREGKFIERGKALYEQGDLVKAQLEFRNALQINPKSIDPQYHLMLIAERQGNWQEAYRRALALTQQDPSHRPAQIKLGHYYLLANDLEKAKEQEQIVAKLGPDDAELATLDAAIALREGRNADAITAANRALGYQADHVGAAMMLSSAEERSGDAAAALKTLSTAIDHHPDDAGLRLQRVRINVERGQFDAAIADYRTLIEKQPDSFAFRLGLSQLYASRDRLDDAEAVLRQALADNVGGTQAKTAMIDLLSQRRGFDAADAELKRLIAADPENYTLQFKRVDLLMNNKRVDEGEAVLKSIIEKDGTGTNGINARVALARLALLRGDRDQAQALDAEILKADAGNADGLLIRGALALAKGDSDGAVADARTVLRTNPRSLPALRLLANAQLARNEVDLAMDTLGQLIELDANELVAREQLAGLHARRGNVERAMALYDAVLVQAPNRITTLVPKAEMLIALQRWRDAEQVIKTILSQPDQEAVGQILSGRYNLARSQPNEALQAFQRALALQPHSPEALSGIVQSYAAAKRPADAVPFLEQQAAASPDNAFIWNMLGEVQARQKATGPAAEAFRKAIAQQPSWPTPYINLSALQLSTGDGAAAVATLTGGVEQTKGDTRMLFALADAQERSGDYKGAMATYERLLAISVDLDVAANNYAALVADFDYQDPVKLAHAIDLSKRFETSDNPLFLDTLGWALYRKGDFAQARTFLERAVNLRMDVPIIYYHLGMALYHLGDREGARAALQKAVASSMSYPGKEEAVATLKALNGA